MKSIPAKPKSNPPSRMRLSAPSLRVLLVDDEPTLLRALKRGFSAKRPNWIVLAVSGPIEAMCRLESDVFDVVLSDYEMPQLNGVELMKLARRHQPAALRVILSALPRQEVGSIPVGLLHGWLAKQGEIGELIRQCEELLMKRAQRKVRPKAG